MSYELVEETRPKGDASVGAAAFAAAFFIYAVTLAPTVTWWDSGELIAAVHSFGIPHPPGTPLYVLLARVWAIALWPLDYAVRVNLFSAFATAAAVGIFAVLMSRWTRDNIAGFAAALCAGAGSTVWQNANEAEVYALALLASAVVLWTADRAASAPAHRRWSWIILCAYTVGLAWAVHLAALVIVPAAAVLLLHRWENPVNSQRFVRYGARAAAAAALGATAVLFLFVRAQHDPGINQGNPDTIQALVDVLARAQYPDPGYWPRQAPLWLQIGNWFEYADWQFALGLHPEPPSSWGRTSVSVGYLLLGLVGSRAHRRMHRASWRALLAAFLTAAFGVALYLNLKAGPSYGRGFLPDGAGHEARERDYFFALSFFAWGLWAGLGAVHLARARAMAWAGVVAAALPIALNWRAVDRAHGAEAREARTAAVQILGAAPQRAMLFVAGDNDTYPLWYAQEVETYRRDVVVVTIPLLGAGWYRSELARRHGLLDGSSAAKWRGLQPALAELCARAIAARRPIALAPNVAPRTLAPPCDPTR